MVSEMDSILLAGLISTQGQDERLPPATDDFEPSPQQRTSKGESGHLLAGSVTPALSAQWQNRRLYLMAHEQYHTPISPSPWSIQHLHREAIAGAHFTGHIPIIIQIQWKFCHALIQISITWLLQNLYMIAYYCKAIMASTNSQVIW